MSEFIASNDPVTLLFRHAEHAPDSPAVCEINRIVSYAEFANYVRNLAYDLSGCAEQPRVLISMSCGFHAYAAMFATLMAGGYYAPLNTGAPLSVRQRIFELFEPDVVVGEPTDVSELNTTDRNLPVIDPNVLSQNTLSTAKTPHTLAYVIFTSGSTGLPKGVMVPRAGLENYIGWMREDMAIMPDDRWSQHPNIGFDLSVMDVYGALTNGASLHPIGVSEGRLMPAAAIKRRGLTIWNSVPSVVDIMIQSHQLTADNLASLRLMTFCGEPLLEDHLQAIFAARPDLVVHNTYGPTEATVSCTLLRLTVDNYRQCCDISAALGSAISGMDIKLVDGPNADEGEIEISGPQVANGYWQDETATDNAFSADAVMRSFRTGDWAERVDKNLYFRSRIDRQIKIMGHRLELSEVDAAIRRFGIPAAACTFVDGKIYGFLQASADNVQISHLRQFLGEHLEPYAIPFDFYFLPTLPRNTNDKIDMKALAALCPNGDTT